jgi:hypothetical protein
VLRTTRLALLLCVVTVIVPARASAHMPQHPTHMTASYELHYGEATVRHARIEIASAKRLLHAYRSILHPHASGWRMLAASAQDVVVLTGMQEQRIRLHNHRWLLGYGRGVIAHARSRMAPPVPSLPWPFWNCVATGWTGGAYGHGVMVSHGEGGATSYNSSGPYYGRYQMDWGFMRRHGPDMLRKYGGRDARSWSVLDQTIAAERGWQAQHTGGWPVTSPPCVFLR